jgi:hypothetical protein
LGTPTPKIDSPSVTPIQLSTMSSMIQSPSDISVSKIEFAPVKILDNGGKSVNLRYEGRNIMVELPSLAVPYGVNVFDKNGPPKYSVDLSFRGADDNDAIRSAQDFFEAFDERMIDAGVENASKWFKMTNPNREVIKAFYTPVVKISRDATGAPKPYPPTIKVSLRKRKDDSFETDFYNGNERDAKGQITAFSKDSDINTILPKRSQATTIIACTGVWFAGGKFGTTWKAVQMRVDSQPEQIRGPAFKSDAPDIRAYTAAKNNGSAAAVATYDDEEDDDAGDVMAAVLPSKAVAKPAVAVPTFKEDEVVEAVPVPKKVIKKVVTGIKK